MIKFANETLLILSLSILYFWFNQQLQVYFIGIYSLCLIFNQDQVFKSKKKSASILKLLIGYPVSYFLIKEHNPFYHLCFFFLPFKNFFKGIFILVFLTFLIRNDDKFFLSQFFRRLFSSWKNVLLAIVLLSLINFSHYFYRTNLFIYFEKRENLLATRSNHTFYIVSMFKNNEEILHDWVAQAKLLISYLGATNVYVSIVENGDSTDKTPDILRDFESYLNKIHVPNKFIFDHVIERQGLERIVFLSEIRKLAMEFLYEIPNLDFNKTTIIFFNDIIYNYQDIVKLIGTNKGDYDLACGMDYYESFYDTWVSIGLDGESFRHYYPYMVNKVAQDTYIDGGILRTFSCWNGVAAIHAEPFKDRKVKFRYGEKMRQSECTLLCTDLYLMGKGKVLVDTNLIFTYEYGYYYKNKYLYYWTKSLFTYFYYYFKFSIIARKNYEMADLTSPTVELSPTFKPIVEKYFSTSEYFPL